MIARKRVLDIVRAFALSELKYCGAELHIYGDGDEMQTIINYIQREQIANITLFGHIDDPLIPLLSADVYVSASSAEGLPLSVIEAKCSGLRLLLSDIPPHRELIFPASEYCELFKLGDVLQLAELMKKSVIDGSENSLKNDVYKQEKVFDYYSSKRMSSCYQNIYNTI